MSFVSHEAANNKSEQKSSLHSYSLNSPPQQTLTPISNGSNGSNTPITDLNGPWLNYSYPSKWEISDDFMCVHFIPKTADKATWKSQCIFWNEAISVYASQLLYECPFKYNRLTFTPLDIQRAHTRKNRLIPMCIIEILKWMKLKKKNILFVKHLENNYCVAKHNDENNNNEMIQENNNSLLSFSGMTSMVSSVFEYFIANDHDGTNSNSDNEYDSDFDDHNNNNNKSDDIDTDYTMNICDNTKCIYTPIIDELCERMSHLNFYKKTYNGNTTDLSELVEIGIINSTQNSNKFIMNGLVFYKFCIQVLNLTVFDVNILKKYLIFQNKIKLFYLNDENSMNLNENMNNNLLFTTKILNENINNNNFHELKNEMIYFNCPFNELQISQEEFNKMQLLSINLTMKYLRFQKNENENNLNDLNHKIINKLKNIPSEKRKEFMRTNILLFKRKKLLKKRISSLDGSIYNLESTLHSMEDMNINKMVFNEMKCADKILKDIIKQTPNINQIETMHSNIKESMQMNDEISDMLGKSFMDTDIDDEELLKEYQDLEMNNMKQQLPDAPNHDIIIKDNVNDIDHDEQVIDQAKQVLIN